MCKRTCIPEKNNSPDNIKILRYYDNKRKERFNNILNKDYYIENKKADA